MASEQTDSDPSEPTEADRGGARLPSGRSRHRYSREFVAESQRERLEDAMARAVAAKGYRAATVADVIKIARVSRKTFYEHFKDFEDCYLASYDAAVPILIERVDTAYNEADGPWPDKIKAGLGAMAEFIAHEPDFAQACIVEVLGAGPGAVARRDWVMRGLAAWFDSERGEVGEPISEPGLLAEMVVDGVYGVVYTRLARGDEIDAAELGAEIAYLALFPYLGDERAREVAGLK